MLCPKFSRAKLHSFLTFQSNGNQTIYMEKFFRALGPDGVFILHQISLNIGDLPTRF